MLEWKLSSKYGIAIENFEIKILIRRRERYLPPFDFSTTTHVHFAYTSSFSFGYGGIF